MRKTIELDYSDDRDCDLHISMGEELGRPIVEASVRRHLAEHGPADATFVIKQVFGPGGGAAVIDFTMEEEDLRPFLMIYNGGDEEQVEYDLECAVPAA